MRTACVIVILAPVLVGCGSPRPVRAVAESTALDDRLSCAHLQGELEAAGWTVRPDPTVARGGCIASAASGERDATLATRWTRVVKALGRDDPWEPPHD